MGGFGIVDKPRKYYRIYFGVRKRKWWWYSLFWTIVVILTNEYIIHKCIHNIHGTPSKHRWSRHYLESQCHVHGKIWKIQCRVIWSLDRHLSSYKKNKIGLFLIFIGVNNDIRQSTTGMNQNQNCHNPKKKKCWRQ